ncbi:MAG: efflux RND transporter periplasmic adaptor subunit [Lactobacillales bacterium]|jgi:HlyD family secretion protein|nr:efflux RND transporter periplasmic adaptor subunit [Lactobacillales bacterium]
MSKKAIGYIIVGIAIVGLAILKFALSGKFTYAGTLETTKVIISSKVSSDITDFPVIEGDTVKQGDLLLQMSCDNYKVLAPQINNDYERGVVLLKKGHLSQSEFDVLERNKKDNDLKIKWCTITSPIDGVVITKYREMGEVVGAGTSLLSIADPYDIWAYFYIPHDKVHEMSLGQTIIGFLPEMPDKTFTGKIIKINEEAEFTPKNVQTRDERTRLVYGIKVQFENPDLILKSGMTIESYLGEE